MADKLKKRQGQVVEDMESLKSAGANSIDWTGSDADSDLVTVKSMRWAAATLLSRAFNLQIPTPGPTGARQPRSWLTSCTIVKVCLHSICRYPHRDPQVRANQVHG